VVLAARLSPAELPAPPARPARPPWCGECDQATRMLGFDGDAPRPCYVLPLSYEYYDARVRCLRSLPLLVPESWPALGVWPHAIR
jgi:hypothetical protein